MKFKPGDFVELIREKKHHGAPFEVGKVLVVKSISDVVDDVVASEVASLDEWYFSEADLKLVTEIDKAVAQPPEQIAAPWYPTRREYFAAAALEGILANEKGAGMASEHVGYAAVEYADELIKRLDRKEEQDVDAKNPVSASQDDQKNSI